MFLVILVALRTTGKRSIRQLSIFELVLIIGLGSAAGDPMFYDDVGIVPAITVFMVIILLYLSITRLSDAFPLVEKMMEGTPIIILKEGQIIIPHLKQSKLTVDELFAGLRQSNVEHLGQVKIVIMETSGALSILFYDDKDVKYGLPIFPPLQKKVPDTNISFGYISCRACGYTMDGRKKNHEEHQPSCLVCQKDCWVMSVSSRRIS